MNVTTRLLCAGVVLAFVSLTVPTYGQDGVGLEGVLRKADIDLLASEARLRGNPRRGAVLFYTSGAACSRCHVSDSAASPLGPNLAAIGEPVSDRHIVESLLYPSRAIRKGYETLTVVTSDGRALSGMRARETDEQLVLRDATDLLKEIVIDKGDIDETVVGKRSMMPAGLVASLDSEAEFFDLTSYVMQITEGGVDRAKELQPSPEDLVVKDDTKDLDHAGILRSLQKPPRGRGFKAGEKIYQGYCSTCHGKDGNTPSLATARAFGTQKLKFGADPFSMFTTLSRGNGLMAATKQLSPKERYQVVHYIREEFMKKANPAYEPVTKKYLASLPKGTKNGDFEPVGDRDYGPALASQLGKEVTSALTVSLGETTISYDLHSMDQAGIWRGGFLDLDQTQHHRGRGEGVAVPRGQPIKALAGWQWGHDRSFDYPTDGLLPRGPMPLKWLDYHGHSLHGDELVLRYAIDGREILELPSEVPGERTVRHTLRIGPGEQLVLATLKADQFGDKPDFLGVVPAGANRPSAMSGDASSTVVVSGLEQAGVVGVFAASKVVGDTAGMTWTIDDQQRHVLTIPDDSEPRVVDVICSAGEGVAQFEKFIGEAASDRDPADLLAGGPLRWPDKLKTVGYRGLEDGAYAVDTITIPESTPWKTWFRTSAIDFFPDGRMAVVTIGGDVWIVSGVDDDLLDITWKRFAGGLYEPFGVKVVDGMVYVTCKDRLTRLHDLNDDGEADFYESFSADDDVSSFFHAFNFDLHTDAEGNFYYAKSGQYTSYALPGAVVKVSPDGRERSIVCTGLRTPNGMGMMPDGRLTVSDNQGNWMPASKVSLIKQDGFYGYVQTKAGGAWAPDGGRIDHTKVVPPETFDQPIIWMPQDVDNSSGGQIYVDDNRWGPLAGRLFHTSFGKGWVFQMMLQEVDGIAQAAIVRLPHDFRTGVMRGRVNPTDGQLYLCGVDGWNGNGRQGLRDKGIQRIRYTGKPVRLVTDCQVTSDGLQLEFNFPIDAASATDGAAFEAEQWNYHWTGDYGSQFYHPETDEVGTQDVEFSSVTVSDDGRRVDLSMPRLKPVNQLRLRISVEDEDGNPFEEEVYWTINRVPSPSGE